MPEDIQYHAELASGGDLEYQGYTDETAETDRYHEE